MFDAPESEAAIRSGVPPVGAVVSRVIVRAQVVDVLPAASLRLRPNRFGAVGSQIARRHRQGDAAGGRHRPAVIGVRSLDAPVPPPSINSTVSPAATVGLSATGTLGAVMSVMLSVLETRVRGRDQIGRAAGRRGGVERDRPAHWWSMYCRRYRKDGREYFVPSAPRSPAVTVRVTLPAVTSAAVMVCVTGCASDPPPSFNSTVSPAARLDRAPPGTSAPSAW